MRPMGRFRLITCIAWMRVLRVIFGPVCLLVGHRLDPLEADGKVGDVCTRCWRVR